ncbi:MAG: hypothetical protein VX278_14175, partial [Myxococcota bacterium]|nr:hypothetical protein [Myxococcota bacterium]
MLLARLRSQAGMSLKKLRNILEKSGASPTVIDEILSDLDTLKTNVEVTDVSDVPTVYGDREPTLPATEFEFEEGKEQHRQKNAYAKRYDVVETLGSGGMGSVYKVYDTLLRRHVAMKTIHKEFIQHASLQ